jgi:hypothetical protein
MLSILLVQLSSEKSYIGVPWQRWGTKLLLPQLLLFLLLLLLLTVSSTACCWCCFICISAAKNCANLCKQQQQIPLQNSNK